VWSRVMMVMKLDMMAVMNVNMSVKVFAHNALRMPAMNVIHLAGI